MDQWRALLIQSLEATLSPDYNVRAPAEQNLVTWETECKVGYTSLLLSLVNVSLNPTVQLAAALRLKSIVEKNWRRRPGGQFPSISDEEKKHIRSTLLAILNQNQPKIALHIALVIGTIARIDYPHQWAEVLQSLAQILQSTPNNVERYNAALSLQLVIKNLSNKRLSSSRKEFEQVTTQFLPFIVVLWSKSSNTVLSALGSVGSDSIKTEQLESVIPIADLCIFSLKMIKYMFTEGLPADFSTSRPETLDILNQVLSQQQIYLSCKENIASNVLIAHVDKILSCLNKLVLNTQRSHPLAFIPVLQPFLEFYYNQLFTDLNKKSERFLVQAMIFIKSILDCSEYQVSQKKMSPIHEAGAAIITKILNETNVTNLCSILITKLFPLSKSNLDEWESNPEDYFNEEEQDSWQDRKKPCAENLYLTLLQKYRDWLAARIITLLKDILDQQNQSPGPNSILIVDACYSAIGLGYYYLYDHVDFSNWFISELAKELQHTNPNYKILRRRIAWLLGYWVGKVSKELRPTVYSVLLNLMEEEDLVVSLTATKALKAFIDDVEFSSDTFIQHLQRTITLLFQLLHKLDECDAKLQVLSAITVVINQLEKEIVPYAGLIVNEFKTLWEASSNNESYNFLKQSIVQALSTLSQLVLSSGPSDQSNIVLQFVVPIIKHSTDLAQLDSIYLVEDGLSLWFATISNTPQMNDALLFLYPNITTIMLQTFEFIKIIMKIIEEYLVLGKGDFLQRYLGDLVTVFNHVIGNVKDLPTIWTMKPIEILIQLFPMQAPSVLEAVLIKFLNIVFDETQTDLIICHSICILLRVLLQNPTSFYEFFQKASSVQGENLLARFLEVVFEKMDSVPQSKMKKLIALSLSVLLKTSDLSVVASFLGQVLTVCSGVIMDAHRDADDFGIDDITFVGEEILSDSVRSSAAKQQLLKSDPVFQLDVQTALQQALNETSNRNGQNFQQIFQNLDPTIVSGLNRAFQHNSGVNT